MTDPSVYSAGCSASNFTDSAQQPTRGELIVRKPDLLDTDPSGADGAREDPAWGVAVSHVAAVPTPGLVCGAGARYTDGQGQRPASGPRTSRKKVRTIWWTSCGRLQTGPAELAAAYRDTTHCF